MTVSRIKVRGAEHDKALIGELNSLKRGRVLWVDLRGARGQELKSIHPCVIVSNATLNDSQRTLMVVPLCTHEGTYEPKAYEVALASGDGELELPGAAVPHQVRTIDRWDDRIVEIGGTLSDQAMGAIEDMLLWAITDDDLEDE